MVGQLTNRDNQAIQTIVATHFSKTKRLRCLIGDQRNERHILHLTRQNCATVHFPD
jgi:hypothetical protein